MTKIDLDFLYEPEVDSSKDRRDLLAELAQHLADRERVPPLLADWFCYQLKSGQITIKRRRGRKSGESSARIGKALAILEGLFEQGVPTEEAIKRVIRDLSLQASRETVHGWLHSVREANAECAVELQELYQEKAIEHFRALAKNGITGPEALNLQHWGPGERALYGSKKYMEQLQLEADYHPPE